MELANSRYYVLAYDFDYDFLLCNQYRLIKNLKLMEKRIGSEKRYRANQRLAECARVYGPLLKLTSAKQNPESNGWQSRPSLMALTEAGPQRKCPVNQTGSHVYYPPVYRVIP